MKLPLPTLRNCVIDGSIDITHYLTYYNRINNNDKNNFDWYQTVNRKRKLDESKIKVKIKRIRPVKSHKLYVRNSDGSLRVIAPRDTLWYLLYIQTPPQNARMARKFRMRFRLPHSNFMALSMTVSEHAMFERWSKCDCYYANPSDTRLLMLEALRYFGRGFTVDDIEEATAISAETHRQVFHIWIEYGSTIL